MDQQPIPRQDSDCPDLTCRDGKRNRYFRHKAMMASDLALEQRYMIERRRLLSRAIAGWGIAYGFKLELRPGANPDDAPQLLCGPGLALDQAGRELWRVDCGALPACDLLILDKALRQAAEDARDGDCSKSFRCVLSVRYAEQPVDKVRISAACGCGESDWNHVCETVIFGLEPICGDAPCPPGETECRTCHCHPVYGRSGEHHRDRTGCLCEWQTDPMIARDRRPLAHCKGRLVALEDPLQLACVTIGFDRCGCPVIHCIDDACRPRRWIKTNEVLYDLIRGCDLTRIETLSWGEWHRRREPVPWDEFRDKFPRPPRRDYDDPADDDSAPRHLQSHFVIRFSGPVQSNTLTPDCVVFTVFSPDELVGMLHARRLRIPELQVHPRHEHDPEDTTRGATLMFDERWVEDQIWDRTSLFRHPHTRVEIEIRGDEILDFHGQPLDGEAIGFRPAPSGNGSPGGTNLTTFRVQPRSHHVR